MQPTKLNILVVDDTPVIGEVFSQIFTVLGHEPTVVSSAEAAIALLERSHAEAFDVIFSDISMPGMNGHQFAQRLAERRGNGQLRVRLLVAMSGYSDPAEQARSLESGFDRHIVKPPDVEDLELLLNELCVK